LIGKIREIREIMLFPNISHHAFVYHMAYNIVSIDYLEEF